MLPPIFVENVRRCRHWQTRFFRGEGNREEMKRQARTYEALVDTDLLTLPCYLTSEPFCQDVKNMRYWQDRYFAGDTRGETVGSARKFEARVDRHLARLDEEAVQLNLF